MDQRLISREQILKYRTLTFLLHFLNNVKPADKSSRGGRVVIDEAANIDKKGIWRSMTSVASILVRSSEVVALLPGTMTSEAFNIQLALESMEESHTDSDISDPELDDVFKPLEHVLLTTNTPDFHNETGMSGKEIRKDTRTRLNEPHKLSVTLESTIDTAGVTNMATDKLLQAMYSKYAIDSDGQLPFNIHAQIVLKLLVACYDSNGSNRAQLVKLATYISCVSAVKVAARFKISTSGTLGVAKNFSEYIMKADNEYPAGAFDDEEGLTLDQPTSKEIEQLQMLRQRLPDAICKEIYGSKSCDDSPEMPLFDKAGRKRLLCVLRYLLRKAIDSTYSASKVQIEFRKKMKSLQCDKLLKPEEAMQSKEMKDLLRKVYKESILAWNDVNGLLHFLLVFGRAPTSGNQPPLLLKLLKWIQKVFDIKHTSKNTPQQSVPSPTSSLEGNKASNIEKSIEESEFQPMDTSSEDVEEGMHITDIADVFSNYSDEAEANELENTFMSQSKGGGWAQAALQWMNLCCTHHENVTKLEPGIPKLEFRKAIGRVSINIIKTELNKNDKEMERPIDVIKEIDYEAQKRVRDGGYSEQKLKFAIQAFQDAWRQQSQTTDPSEERDLEKCNDFGGHCHCETLLLSLHLFAKYQETPFSNQAFAISNEALAKFKLRTLRHSVAVSRRCCPACYELIKIIREQQRHSGETELTFEGWHKSWFQASLPPWLPKLYADRLVNSAKEQLIDSWSQMTEAAIEKAKKRRQESSSGKHSSHTPQPTDRASPDKSEIVDLPLEQSDGSSSAESTA